MNLSFGSLFAGIGGFDLGFERAGMTCSWQVEIDEFNQKVLAKHWPKVRRHDDVKTFPPRSVSVRRELSSANDPGISCLGGADCIGEWGVDVICGGDPCQENSRARVAANTTSPSLAQEFLRIVSALRPTYVVRENPRFVRKDAPWPWWRFCDELKRIGYCVQPVPIRACCFGYPHRRERMFVFGQRSDSYREPLWVPGCGEAAGAEGGLQEKAQQRQRIRIDVGTMVRSKRRETESGIDGATHGLSSGVDRNKRMRACGNAIVPDVAEWVGQLIVKDHFLSNSPLSSSEQDGNRNV